MLEDASTVYLGLPPPGGVELAFCRCTTPNLSLWHEVSACSDPQGKGRGQGISVHWLIPAVGMVLWCHRQLIASQNSLEAALSCAKVAHWSAPVRGWCKGGLKPFLPPISPQILYQADTGCSNEAGPSCVSEQMELILEIQGPDFYLHQGCFLALQQCKGSCSRCKCNFEMYKCKSGTWALKIKILDEPVLLVLHFLESTLC